MKCKPTLLACLLVVQALAVSGIGWCQDSKISVKAEVDHAFFTIGDLVVFKIIAEHDSSIQIARIDTAETLKDFEVKEEKDIRNELSGLISEGKEIALTGYELGDYVLSPAVIYYREAGSQELKQIESNKLYVSIESVDKSGKKSNDIADIKSVVDLSRKWIGWLIAFLLLVFGAGAFYFYYFRQQTILLNLGTKNELTPHEEAYRELNRLYDSEMLQRGQLKLYFARMSEIIRRYIERRYNVLALESTTAEIMQEIRCFEIDGKTLSLIKNHLEICDLVKFAKYRPEPPEIIRQTKLAKEIIDVTKSPDHSSLNDSEEPSIGNSKVSP